MLTPIQSALSSRELAAWKVGEKKTVRLESRENQLWARLYDGNRVFEIPPYCINIRDIPSEILSHPEYLEAYLKDTHAKLTGSNSEYGLQIQHRMRGGGFFLLLIPAIKAAVATYGVTVGVGAGIDVAVYCATENNASFGGACKAAGTGALTALVTAGTGNFIAGAAKATKVAKAVTQGAVVVKGAQKAAKVGKAVKTANAAVAAIKGVAKQSAASGLAGATGGAVRAACAKDHSLESIAKGAVKGAVGGACSGLVPIDEAESALSVITKSAVAGASGSGAVQVVDNAMNGKDLGDGMKEALTQGAIIGGVNGAIRVAMRKDENQKEESEKTKDEAQLPQAKPASQQNKETPRGDGNVFEGCVANDNAGDGFVVTGSDNVKIINCQANGNGGNGLRVEQSKNVTVAKSEFNDNGSAAVAMKSVTNVEIVDARMRFRDGHRMEIPKAYVECPLDTHLKLGANAKLEATIKRLQEAYRIGSTHRGECGLSDRAFTDLSKIVRNPTILNPTATCKQFGHVHPKAVANLQHKMGSSPYEIRGAGIQGSGILAVNSPKNNGGVNIYSPQGLPARIKTIRLEGISHTQTTAYSMLAELNGFGQMQGTLRTQTRSWISAQSELLSATFRATSHLDSLANIVNDQVNNLRNLRNGEYRILPSGYNACPQHDAGGHAFYMLMQQRNGVLFPEIHNCGARNYSVPVVSSLFGVYPDWHATVNNNVRPFPLSPFNQNNVTSLNDLVDVTIRAYFRPVVCDHGAHVSQMQNMAEVYNVRNPATRQVNFSYPNQEIGNCASHNQESILYRVMDKQNADFLMQYHREWIAKLKEEQTSN